MENEIHSASIELNDATSVSAQKPKGGWRAIKFILGNEAFEKLASMSLVANMTVYLRNVYNMDGILLVNIINIWSGSSNITPIAGAVISDAYLGRFLTLLLGTFATMLGMMTFTLTAAIPELRPKQCHSGIDCDGPQFWQLGFLYTALALLAIGSGGIRPCNIAFGADQFDTNTKKGKAAMESFFNWWYFSFTISLLIALTGVVYVQTNISWVIGFAIPTFCLVISITIFLVGKYTYILVKPQGSIFTDIMKVIIATIRKRRIELGQDDQHTLYDPQMDEVEKKLPCTNRFRAFDKAAIITNPNELNNEGIPINPWKLCSVQQVEQLKCLVAILPVWLSGITCFIAMDQQSIFGILQAIQTNRSIGHFDMPPGWMGLTSMVALSICVFIYESIYGKKKARNKRLTTKQRIRIGIVMGILCTIVAGCIERVRKKSAIEHGTFESPISFTILLPQFILSGLTEAFGAIAIMEFLTMQMPESMRTVAGAVFFLSFSISSYTSSIIVNVINVLTKHSKTPWLGGHDLNKIKLDYYYFVITGMGILNFIYFQSFAQHYVRQLQSKNDGSEDDEDNKVAKDLKNEEEKKSENEHKHH